ncbi:MAG: hypothetical protein AABZ47_04425 [Planctomycetota bacterium]
MTKTVLDKSTDPRTPSPWDSLATSTTDLPRATASVTEVLTAFPGGVLHGDEIVLLAIKPSMWRPVFVSGPWLLTALGLAAVSISFGQPLPGLSLTATAQTILLIGLARLGWSVACWLPRWHVLTNRRIVDIRGIRHPSVQFRSLVDIRNTYVRRSLVERLTGSGTVLFVPKESSNPPVVWRSIAQPDFVHAKIRRAIENALD